MAKQIFPMKIYIIVITLFFIGCDSSSQNLIVGRWKNFKSLTESGKDGPDGIPFNPILDYEFTKDSITSYYQNKKEFTLKYEINGDTLIVYYPKKGSISKRVIEKLTQDELVLLDENRQAVLGNQRIRDYFKRK